MLKKLEEKFTRHHFILSMAFVLPVFFMLIGFIIRGVAPFGDRSLLSMDGYGQYFAMLQEMRRAWRAGAPFYSFDGNLGFNLWAQNAYYTNSPLWWILFLLPEGAQISGIDLLVLLRFGLAGLFFCIRLERRHPSQKHVWVHPALSLAYAVSAYTIAFVNQLMWMDAIVLLPLVILGAEELLEGKKSVLYTVTLFLTLWSCFYIGFMVCVFLVLYALVQLFGNKMPWKMRFKQGGRFALCSLLGGGMAAVILLPAYKAIQNTIASDLTFDGKLKFYHKFWEVLRQFLPFQKISLAYEAPNLYCGVLVVLAGLVYLCLKSIPLRRRIAHFLLLALMGVSMNLNVLDYVWHGFHYPNQLPGRESFLLIFLLIAMAAGAMERIKMKEWLSVTLAVLLMAEVGCSSVYQFGNQTWISANASLLSADSVMEDLPALPSKTEFYRIAWASPNKHNPGQHYGYPGVTYYSSTMTGASYTFYQKMGLPRYAKNVSVTYEESLVLNTLFGIRYIYRDGQWEENRRCLPLAFRTDSSVEDFNSDDLADIPTVAQNQLWEAVTGAPYDRFLPSVQRANREGLVIEERTNTKITGSVNAWQDGVLFTTLPYDGGWRISIDGEQVSVKLLCGNFCGADITKGKHQVEFRYTPPGFYLGLTVSLACLLGFVWASLVDRKKRK